MHILEPGKYVWRVRLVWGNRHTHICSHKYTPSPSFDLYYTQPRDLRRVYKLIMDRQPSTTPKPSWWYTVQHCTTPCCSFMGFVWIDTHTHTHIDTLLVDLLIIVIPCLYLYIILRNVFYVFEWVYMHVCIKRGKQSILPRRTNLPWPVHLYMHVYVYKDINFINNLMSTHTNII